MKETKYRIVTKFPGASQYTYWGSPRTQRECIELLETLRRGVSPSSSSCYRIDDFILVPIDATSPALNGKMVHRPKPAVEYEWKAVLT